MMKQKKGSIFRNVVLSGIILIIAIIAGMYLFFPAEKIKSMVIPEVEKMLGRKISVGKASVTIFPGVGLSLNNIEISNTSTPGFSSAPFVKMDRFLVQITLSSLFKKQPEISRIVLQRPQILVEVDQDGVFNYADMPVLAKDTTKKEQKKSSGLPSLPVPITLKNFIISDCSILYDDRKAQQQIIIGCLNDRIDFSIDKALKDIRTTGNLVISQISVKTKETKKPLTDLTFTLDHSITADLITGKANVEQFRLSLQKIFVNLTGTVSDLNNAPELDLSLKSDPITIKDLLAEIPVELVPDVARLTATGTADLGLVIKGVLREGSTIPVNGTLKISDVMIKYTDLPKSISSLNADLAFTDTSVLINSLKCKFGENPVELHASFVNFKNPFVDLAILAKINLDDMKDIMQLPAGASLAGLTDFDITAKGLVDPSDPSKLDVKGKLHLTNVSVLWPPLAKPAQINGLFTLSSKAIGQNVDVKIGKSSLVMAASISNYLSLVFADSTKKLPRPQADFKLTSSFLDIDEILPPSKDSVSAKPASQQSADIPLIAPLPGVDMKGSVIADKIIYQGIDMNKMDMKVNIVNDIADLNIKTGFASGTISEVIHADLRNTNNIIFTNKLDINNVEVNYLLGRFGKFIQPTTALNRELINVQNSLFGKVIINSNMSGNGGTSQEITKSLKGDIVIKMADGKIVNSIVLQRLAGVLEKFVKIEDLQFRDMKAIMHIENEQAIFNSFQIFSGIGDWDIKGAVGFDASLALNVNNRLPREISQKLLSVQDGGKNLVKGLLQGTKLATASSLVDDIGIPSDRDGRVTVKMGLGGTVADPKASFSGFGEGSAQQASQDPQKSVKEQVTQKVQEVVKENTEMIQQKLEAERQAAAAEAQRRLDEERVALEAQKKIQEEKLKNEAKKLRGLFK
jgi:hypothetical protein